MESRSVGTCKHMCVHMHTIVWSRGFQERGVLALSATVYLRKSREEVEKT